MKTKTNWNPLLCITCTAACIIMITSCTTSPTDQAPFVVYPTQHASASVGQLGVEAPSALDFDSRNRPYMFRGKPTEAYGSIWTLRKGRWVRLNYLEAVRKLHPDAEPPGPDGHERGLIRIDSQDRLYAIVKVVTADHRPHPVLLYSPDLGESFQCYDIPDCPDMNAMIETRTCAARLDGPPPILFVKSRKPDPRKDTDDWHYMWSAYCELVVYLPEFREGRLDFGEPIPIASDAIGIGYHSGGLSPMVTADDKTYLVYAATPSDAFIEEHGNGTPTYVVTIDHKTRHVSERYLLGIGVREPLFPDVHAQPTITMDSQGYLHALIGAHSMPFQYVKSARPLETEAWSPAEQMRGNQCYTNLRCDSRDVLHLLYRVHPQLLYQQRSTSGTEWSEPTPLAKAQFPADHYEGGYTVFYHHTYIDRQDAIYASFTFFHKGMEEGEEFPRYLVVSEDGGRSWQAASQESMARRILPLAEPAAK